MMMIMMMIVMMIVMMMMKMMILMTMMIVMMMIVMMMMMMVMTNTNTKVTFLLFPVLRMSVLAARTAVDLSAPRTLEVGGSTGRYTLRTRLVDVAGCR